MVGLIQDNVKIRRDDILGARGDSVKPVGE